MSMTTPDSGTAFITYSSQPIAPIGYVPFTSDQIQERQRRRDARHRDQDVATGAAFVTLVAAAAFALVRAATPAAPAPQPITSARKTVLQDNCTNFAAVNMPPGTLVNLDISEKSSMCVYTTPTASAALSTATLTTHPLASALPATGGGSGMKVLEDLYGTPPPAPTE